ncbi:MAG: MgtC/SapB family protein [Aquabacterium sp.]|uniref:MgtC/SapB family protein n=1 Tax=Aquabacterium sp. TaxID=1872578 RepID=UPI003BB0D9E3
MLLVLQKINPSSLTDTAVSLAAAFILGGLIGLERQYRQRTAGLRTNVLVAVGAAVFVDLASHLQGAEGATHVMAYVVSGIGFLGAGVIMREEGNVRGLNTAATLWGSAAVGAAAGADLIGEALLAALCVLAANTLLRPVVNAVNSKPLDVRSVEVTNTVFVIADKAHQKVVLAAVEEEFEHRSFPALDLRVHAFGHEEIEIEVKLASTAVEGQQLDTLVARLLAMPAVKQAFWSPSTSI